MMRRALFVFFIMTLVHVVNAQVSPSTIGIINPEEPQRSSQGEPADLSSGRYKVRPKSTRKEKPLAEEYEKSQTPPKKVEAAKEESLPAKVELPAPEKSSTLIPAPSPVVPEPAPMPVLGPSEEPYLDEYRSFLPPDDARRNLIDIKFAPIFIYNDSSSPYWYRSYTNYAPGFLVNTSLWFTPFFGVEAGYKKSIAGSVRSSATTEQFVSASHEWITAGLRFRRFFGYGDEVPMLLIGLDYREYNFKVPSDDANRVRLKTTSPRLLLETVVPSTPRYSWHYSLEVLPFARHQEVGTGYNLQSGTESENFGFGLAIGGEYKLARTSRMFFKLSYSLERNAFSGPANRTDPVSGTTPSNVPVNNAFTIFEFGYIWGQ